MSSKLKNNHFVPRTYLRRFCSVSERQVALYNLKSGRAVETAPIKSQCSRDYFYTKNPVFEQEFGKIEAENDSVYQRIVAGRSAPAPDSFDRVSCRARSCSKKAAPSLLSRTPITWPTNS